MEKEGVRGEREKERERRRGEGGEIGGRERGG